VRRAERRAGGRAGARTAETARAPDGAPQTGAYRAVALAPILATAPTDAALAGAAAVALVAGGIAALAAQARRGRP
jgi:hypothetical protein